MFRNYPLLFCFEVLYRPRLAVFSGVFVVKPKN